MSWPNDADGEVMRRLGATGFNFYVPTTIDFNIDFDEWPPGARAIEALATQFPDFSVESDYVLVRVHALVTYEFVTATQDQLNDLMAAHGGRCESWGVLYTPPRN